MPGGRSDAARITRVNTYGIRSDPSRLQLDAIPRLAGPQRLVARAIANSLCFGRHLGEPQAGFARVVTDKATFA
jgi:hypothetical protein